MRRNDDPDTTGRRRTARQAGQQRQQPARPRRTGGMLVGGVLAAVVALALVGGSLFAYVKYRQVWDSIKRVDISSDRTGVKQPPVDPHALNILLIGSDSRAGENGKIGGSDGIIGQRSDTVMVLHISPGAHRAVVLSFPRDSVVPIYSCSAEAGSTGQTADTAQIEQINATFANGGPGCLLKTIELTTHIYLNDFVELTFEGFEKVIDDLGGVNVCLPAAVDDPMSGLNLAAGKHHIYGSQALAFWRTREDLGLGSDLQRIQRDQFLMAALLQGIEKSGLLTSTTKMTSVIGDVASHMTTDQGLNQTAMLKIAEGMRGLSSKSVQFIEVPTQAYAPNPDWVQWTDQSDQLFAAVAHDTKLPTAAKTKKASTVVADTVDPSTVNVKVLNGSGLQGVAAEASTSLTSRHFNIVGSGNAPNFDYTKSVIEYDKADLAAARTLKAQLTNVEMLPESSVTAGTVDLVLGSDFTELKAASGSGSTSDLTKTYGGITGDTNVCHDGTAFAG
jgi:LCP family protein required for cell wall assembly